jgi:hypothetical protein
MALKNKPRGRLQRVRGFTIARQPSDVSYTGLGKGFEPKPASAQRQHRGKVQILKQVGVNTHGPTARQANSVVQTSTLDPFADVPTEPSSNYRRAQVLVRLIICARIELADREETRQPILGRPRSRTSVLQSIIIRTVFVYD